MRRACFPLVLLILLVIPFLVAANNTTVKLIDAGISKSMIIHPIDADEFEKLAVAELKEHFEKIAGVQIQSTSASEMQLRAKIGEAIAKGLVPLIVGDIALTAEVKSEILSRGDDPASFMLSVDSLGIRIAGLSSEGTLFGTYELLEQIGCRWFMPGEIGTVIPELDTVALKQQKTIQVPSFVGRWHTSKANQGWQKRFRMGGPYFPTAHGIPPINKKMFADHPEYFALVGGERTTRQVCLSNPEVLRLTIEDVKAYFRKNPTQPWYGMGPNDGSGFCQCENCLALDGGDWDFFSNELAMTDRYIWFFNQVLAAIEDEFPDKKIAFYCYHTYMRPPVKNKPHPNIVPAFAPITLCRVHGMGNSNCPERSYYETIMEQWGQLLPEIYERGYWFNLADPGFPFSLVHRLRDEIPTAKELGITGWRVEAVNHWGSETPSLYIAAKLMWEHTVDVDALLQDFYEKFFGPAAKPMGEYLELMDAALENSDHHTGCSFDMPYFYPQELRDTARNLLQEATRLAGEEIYGTRVQIFKEIFAYLEAFISMLDNNFNFDFLAVKKDLEQIDALREKLVAYEPAMIHPRLSESYLKRFFRQTSEQGYERITGSNQLLVGLPPDEWDFLIDPAKIGEDMGLWRGELTGGNWQKIKTSTSWSNQGLRYYKGDAWYRQRIAITVLPAEAKIVLWFGGIDEAAKVWVNGKEVGVRKGSAFLPFEFEITKEIVPNVENTIVVKITNDSVDELGTGGIVYPVMIYATGGNSNLQDAADEWKDRDAILY